MIILIEFFLIFIGKKETSMTSYLYSVASFLGNITGLFDLSEREQPHEGANPSSIELTDPWANKISQINQKSEAEKKEASASSSALISSSSVAAASTSSAASISATSIASGVLFPDSSQKKPQGQVTAVQEPLNSQSESSTYLLGDGSNYTGPTKNRKADGRGKLVFPKKNSFNYESYEGEFQDGYFFGKGTLIWQSGSKYNGEFIEGRREGFGIYVFNNGRSTYEGFFRDGQFHGRGKLTIKKENGDSYSYEGNFENDLQSGRGKFVQIRHIGDRIMKTIGEGIFIKGKMEGGGTLRDEFIDNLSSNNEAENESGLFSGCSVC